MEFGKPPKDVLGHAVTRKCLDSFFVVESTQGTEASPTASLSHGASEFQQVLPSSFLFNSVFWGQVSIVLSVWQLNYPLESVDRW